MFSFLNMAQSVELLAAQNPDGAYVLTVSNSGAVKLQLQVERNGNWYYIESLPDSVSTIVFE